MLGLYRRLGPELGGAVSAIVDLCCLEGGSLENDDRYIAGQLGLDVRRWKRVKAALIKQGELYEMFDLETGGASISSLIADRIILDGKRRVESGKRAGKISAAKQATKRAERVELSNKSIDNNGLGQTAVQRSLDDKRNRCRQENLGQSEVGPIGKVLDRCEAAIIKAASRRAEAGDAGC